MKKNEWKNGILGAELIVIIVAATATATALLLCLMPPFFTLPLFVWSLNFLLHNTSPSPHSIQFVITASDLDLDLENSINVLFLIDSYCPFTIF